MLYRLQNNVLSINDLIGGTVHQFHLEKFNFHNEIDIKHIVSDIKRDTVIISFDVIEKVGFKVLKTYQEGILLCNMTTNEINMIYDKTCHDIIFDKNNSKQLFIVTDKAIASFCMEDGALNEIYKFKNYKETPMGLKLSEDSKYLLFFKYKSDNKILHLLNLEDNTLNSAIGSTFNYDFLNNNEVVHSMSTGLKVYDIANRKNTIPLPNTTELIKKGGDSAYIRQIIEALNIVEDDQIIIDEVSSPYVFCGRLYFNIFIASNQKRFYKWCSVDTRFNDFQIHCEHPGLWGELYIYGNSTRHIFVVHCCSKEDNPKERKWSCHVYESDNSYILEQYKPIHF